MSELKMLPCPLCGEEKIKVRAYSICADGYAICPNCGLTIGVEVPWGEMNEKEHDDAVYDAILPLWNRRSDAVPVVRGEWVVDECDTTDDVPSSSWIDFHCSECNTDYGLEEGQYGWCRYEKIPYQYCPNCGAKMESEGST